MRKRSALSALALVSVMAIAWPSWAESVVVDRVVAVVDNTIVLKSELDRATERHPMLEEALARLPENASPALVEERRRDVEAKVLDELIDMALIRAEADKYDLRVSEADIDRAARELASNYGLTFEELKSQVEQSADYGSWAEYREDLRDQILQVKVPHYLTSWSVSDAQVREHYRKLTKDETAKVKVAQFSFVPASQDSTAQDRAFAQAQVLGRKLRDGADENELLEQNSAVAQVRAIDRRDLAPALADSVFAAKAGEVLGPLASGQGYVVFKVLEHQASGALSFEDAKERIRDQLESEAFLKAQTDFREQLRAKAHIDIRI